MQKSIEDHEVPGISLLVAKEGKDLCFWAEGMADIEAEKKIERNTIFRMYSQTKPVCAAAAMILVERGLLDLYKPVSELLPGFKNQTVWENGKKRPVKREMMIYDLLQMTSGTCYPDTTSESAQQVSEVYAELENRLYSDNPMTSLEFVNKVGKCSLLFDPGSSWNYGTSADILGAVIEVVSGVSLGEFMKKEIFEPLAMNDTAFWVPADKRERLARSYETVHENGQKKIVIYKGNYLGIQNRMERKPAYEAGGAGLASTLDDYMKFARMLLNGGELNGIRVLRKNTVNYLTGGQLSALQQTVFEEQSGLPGFSYGYLMRVCKDSSQTPVFSRKDLSGNIYLVLRCRFSGSIGKF